MPIHHIYGASALDDVFEITLESGETVIWNVTKLTEAARKGLFGPARYAPTSDTPPCAWENWDATDRAKVDAIKLDPRLLDDPAIGIASPNPDYLLLCIADGQHRVTARQELGLQEIMFYIVPSEIERAFRVTGLLEAFDTITKEGGR